MTYDEIGAYREHGHTPTQKRSSKYKEDGRSRKHRQNPNAGIVGHQQYGAWAEKNSLI